MKTEVKATNGIQINLTRQVFEPFRRSAQALRKSPVLIVIFFKTLPFFNNYFATSFSSLRPLKPLKTIVLRCDNKQTGADFSHCHKLKDAPSILCSILHPLKFLHSQSLDCSRNIFRRVSQEMCHSAMEQNVQKPALNYSVHKME